MIDYLVDGDGIATITWNVPDRPVNVLVEALRLIKPRGRLLLLTTCDKQAQDTIARDLASWCRDAGLRLSPPRAIPAKNPRWLLAVATRTETQTEAA